jgi:hypothetical protein
MSDLILDLAILAIDVENWTKILLKALLNSSINAL